MAMMLVAMQVMTIIIEVYIVLFACRWMWSVDERIDDIIDGYHDDCDDDYDDDRSVECSTCRWIAHFTELATDLRRETRRSGGWGWFWLNEQPIPWSLGSVFVNHFGLTPPPPPLLITLILFWWRIFQERGSCKSCNTVQVRILVRISLSTFFNVFYVA